MLISDLVTVLGKPLVEEMRELGYYPAQRLEFLTTHGILNVFVRHQQVIMLDTPVIPDISILKTLGEPSSILPNEIFADDAYVHEYLYCRKGLVISVAEPFDKSKSWTIHRFRGIHRLESPEDFGPELYMDLDSRISW